jgi:hypothetical protein
VILKDLGAKTNWLAVNRPSQSDSDSDFDWQTSPSPKSLRESRPLDAESEWSPLLETGA